MSDLASTTGRNFHLEAPIGIGEGIAEVAHGGAEPQRIDSYPLAAAVPKDKAGITDAFAVRRHGQRHVEFIVGAGSDRK
jgi:hypothetical protein